HVPADHGIEPVPHPEEHHHSENVEDRESPTLAGPEEKGRFVRDNFVVTRAAFLIEIIVCPVEHRVSCNEKKNEGKNTGYGNPGSRFDGYAYDAVRSTFLRSVVKCNKEKTDDTKSYEEDIGHPQCSVQALQPVGRAMVFACVRLGLTFTVVLRRTCNKVVSV